MLQRFRLVKAIKALMRANMSLQDFLPKLWKMELNTEACRRYRNCKKDVMKDCEARASRASAMNDLEEDVLQNNNTRIVRKAKIASQGPHKTQEVRNGGKKLYMEAGDLDYLFSPSCY